MANDEIAVIPPNTPDIITKFRFDGHARNTDKVKTAIIVPAPISQRIYGELACEVKVFSVVRRGYHFRGLFPLPGLSQRNARQKAGIVAGAMAERLMEITKESVNAVDYANEAMNAFDDAVVRFEAKQFTPVPRDATMDYIMEALRLLEAQS